MDSLSSSPEVAVTKSIIKYQIYLAIAFIIFLVLVIVSGRILDGINKSSCTNDPHIQNSKKWSAWSVGLASTAAALTLIAFIALFFVEV